MDVQDRWYYTMKVRQINFDGRGNDRTFISHPRGDQLSRRIRETEQAYNMDSTVLTVFDPQNRPIYLAGYTCDDCGYIGGTHNPDVEH